jgi:TPR repeat protein
MTAKEVSGRRLLRQANKMLRGGATKWESYVAFLKEAAERGEPEALENLASWYLEGLRTKDGRAVISRSPKRAVRLLELASRAGNANAQNLLGYCFDCGVGAPKDVQRAVKLYLQSYRGGNGMAAANLATIFRMRGNLAGERRWLRRAFELGDFDAGLDLVRTLLAGRSRRSSIEEEGRRVLAVIRRHGNAHEKEEARLLAKRFMEGSRQNRSTS